MSNSSSCPRCFAPVHRYIAAWRCRGSCRVMEDPDATRYSGGKRMVKGAPVMVFRGPEIAQSGRRLRKNAPAFADAAIPDKCPQCNGSTLEVCGTCHHPLPSGWRFAPTLTIAMAGARASGKSLFIGVAFTQFQEFAARNGASLEPADEQTAQVFEKLYREPLYQQMKGMAPTPSSEADDAYQRAPLVWRWVDAQHGVQFTIAIRDVAGEDLESGNTGEQFSFFSRADSVFFLFDPLRIESIREKLRGLVPEQEGVGGDPATVLNSLKGHIGAGRPSVAVILSKFDAMQALREVQDAVWRPVMNNHGAAFNREPPPFSPAYDRLDGKLLHEEVRSLMILLGGSQILNALGQLDYQLFAVSALGEATKGQMLSRHGISPYRCLDPIKWAIDKKSG